VSGFILGRVRHALFEQRWITAALAVTLLAISLLLGWQLERRESADQLRQVNVQAQILAGSVAGALAFDDATTANEYLSALRLDESFRGAAVYGADGRLFAGLAVPGQALPANVTIHPPEISGRKVTVVVPVVQANLNLGSVYLTKIVEPLSTRISRYAAIGLILVFAAALIALLGAASAAAAGANRELQRQILAREKAEIALRQAQKMEALGQLTGGVAHDFNNLLMAASSGLELMQRSQDAERRQKFAEGIRNALDRGAQITQQLLAFSRRSPVQSEVLNVDRHIDDLANLLDHSLRENISVRFSIAGDLWPIDVDVSQFDVAMLNLAVNAKDAMPQGGLLCITAANRPGALAGADAVEIAVEDQGSGMSPETIERAFEPFFTTKGPGRGTGLGLSQVYGFVTAAGGTVSIVSDPGKGTKVILLIPRCNEPVGEQAGPAPPPAEDALQGLRILLVEDDADLNELVSQMLEEQGSKVLRAASGAEGLSLFETGNVDAVLSDMVMPGSIDGLDLARRLRERREGFPVVLMTGYSAAAGSAAAEGFPVLRKPFTMAALTAVLSQALRRPG
jgi:signal transduction histidine kinase